MAAPLRKMPAGRELETAPPGVDPFRYGWRPRYVHLPGGHCEEQRIPLTAEDLLDPQLGDVVVQSDPHFDLLIVLADLLRRHYASREDVFVSGDLKMLWGIPGLPQPAPDIAVIPGVRSKRGEGRSSFDAVQEGTLPCLVIELVSSIDAATRRNDYEEKVGIYQRVGIPEYLILDPPTSATRDRLLLTGYRLGADRRYRRIEPDRDGRLLSETTNLLFGAAEDGRTVLVIDAATGERLLTSRQEEEARKAAESELARLRAELERLNRR
jgi:Uma2 family endonuclease